MPHRRVEALAKSSAPIILGLSSIVSPMLTPWFPAHVPRSRHAHRDGDDTVKNAHVNDPFAFSVDLVNSFPFRHRNRPCSSDWYHDAAFPVSAGEFG